MLSCADFTLDPEKRIARRGDQEVELTVKEFDVCELLMRSPGNKEKKILIQKEAKGY